MVASRSGMSFIPLHFYFQKEIGKMKYCSHCGYSPIHDDATTCPCCGEDVSEQIPYDYPQDEVDSSAYVGVQTQERKPKRRWKDQPLKVRLALVITGFVVIVGACIAILCLF